MRTPIMAVLLVGLSLIGTAPAAEGDAKSKPDAAKGDAKNKPDAAKGDAKDKADGAQAGEQTKTGTVGVKAATAGADVVAMLYTPSGDFKLSAEGENQTKLEILAKKMAKAQVTGTITGDTIKVSQVVDIEHKLGDPKKGKDRKGDKDKKDDAGDKKKKKGDQN